MTCMEVPVTNNPTTNAERCDVCCGMRPGCEDVPVRASGHPPRVGAGRPSQRRRTQRHAQRPQLGPGGSLNRFHDHLLSSPNTHNCCGRGRGELRFTLAPLALPGPGVRDLEQNIGVTRRTKRTPARERLTTQLGTSSGDEVRSGEQVQAVHAHGFGCVSRLGQARPGDPPRQGAHRRSAGRVPVPRPPPLLRLATGRLRRRREDRPASGAARLGQDDARPVRAPVAGHRRVDPAPPSNGSCPRNFRILRTLCGLAAPNDGDGAGQRPDQAYGSVSDTYTETGRSEGRTDSAR